MEKSAVNEKPYVCRRIRLYNYLIRAGFEAFACRKDKFNPDRMVWMFKNSEELKNKVEEYYSLIPKNEN